MPNPHSFTEYQLGTAVYWLMKTPSSGDRRLNLKILALFPIEEDASESWLDQVPEARRIAREVATAALQQLRDNPEQFQIDQLVDAGDEYLSTKSRLDAELKSAEAKYRRALELVLFRPSENIDVDTALQLHSQRRAQRQLLRAAVAEQHLTSLRIDILAKRELDDAVTKALGVPANAGSKGLSDARNLELQQYEQMARFIASREGRDR